MLNYNELRKGIVFVLEGEPHQVVEYEFLRMQQRKPVAKTKLRNLISGKLFERTFHQNETFEEADMTRKTATYLYSNRGEYWFSEKGNPKNRFLLTESIVGEGAQFLKNNTDVTTLVFDEKVISIELPIKVELTVKDAPPSIKGNTAQGGTKAVTLETGAMLNVPLFIDSGDIVRVNTQTGEYVERVEKAK
ncbi:MAG: elongation factor P [Patescibacteria group bacterium]